MLLKAPFLLPPDLLPTSRPQLGRRFVATFWEPPIEGEDASHDRHGNHVCGLCDNWPLNDLVRRPEVRAWLDENGTDPLMAGVLGGLMLPVFPVVGALLSGGSVLYGLWKKAKG